MPHIPVSQVQHSKRSLRELLRPVTLVHASRLSRQLGASVVIASETFQHTGSFKFRAACNVVLRAPNRRILAASSGNFGQALAYACLLLNKSCVVVMPDNSAQVKIAAVREYGGNVDVIDIRTKSRKGRVEELARKDPDVYVASAYDDPLVIEGNATLGQELAALDQSFDFIIAPVGGGGLTAGLIQGLRAAGNTTLVMGVEPLLANDAARSLAAGRIIVNDTEPQTIADGVRTLSLGEHNWRVLREGLAGIVEVTEEQIKVSIRLLFSLANLKAEPTGALSVAALLARPELFRDRSVCCVVSGGNVDPEVFRSLLEG
jgi:threonine dehydratase